MERPHCQMMCVDFKAKPHPILFLALIGLPDAKYELVQGQPPYTYLR